MADLSACKQGCLVSRLFQHVAGAAFLDPTLEFGQSHPRQLKAESGMRNLCCVTGLPHEGSPERQVQSGRKGKYRCKVWLLKSLIDLTFQRAHQSSRHRLYFLRNRLAHHEVDHSHWEQMYLSLPDYPHLLPRS